MKNDIVYDVVIIGAGPAGLSAAIYTSRALLKTLVLTSFTYPPQAVLTDIIENYPGFPEGINGFDLIEQMKQQAEKFKTEFLNSEVIKIEQKEKKFLVHTQDDVIETKSVIVATGRRSKKLGVGNEEKFIGKGISYCAVCDAQLFKDKIVAVVGGGDTAFTEAVYLTKFVKKLYLIHRRKEFRATKILQEQLKQKNNVEFLTPYVVDRLIGEEKISGVLIKNVETQNAKEIFCDGVFICVGYLPNTEFLKGIVNLDEEGYIITDENLQTSASGIFACGDCRKNSVKQVICAAAEGVKAALSAVEFLERNFGG
jgi:thioredoxin reductase (NADPH)